MRKRRNFSTSGKRVKPKRRESFPDGDPEWDHLEERFNTLNADFNKLAEIVGREEKDET